MNEKQIEWNKISGCIYFECPGLGETWQAANDMMPTESRPSVCTLLPDVLLSLELGLLQSSFENWNRKNTDPNVRMKKFLSSGGGSVGYVGLLTVSHQDQWALGLGLAVVDLDGVGSLAGSGEVLHYHLDDSCRDVVADLVALRGNVYIRMGKERQESSELWYICMTDPDAVEYRKNLMYPRQWISASASQ